ncbi:hypothetical protein KGO95_00995 [Patescibacteria group bacterium]|nr:hypothetical protein [Patescibacteria group bacterium]
MAKGLGVKLERELTRVRKELRKHPPTKMSYDKLVRELSKKHGLNKEEFEHWLNDRSYTAP